MPAVTRSTIQVHSFGEQLSTRITPSLPAPHHPASETLHLHDFITAAAHQQCVSRCEKYNYKSKSYIWCSSNLPKDPALQALPKTDLFVCVWCVYTYDKQRLPQQRAPIFRADISQDEPKEFVLEHREMFVISIPTDAF